MQIRTRLTIQFIYVVALIIFFSFGVIYYSSSEYRKKEFYKRLENKATTSVDLLISINSVDSATLITIDKVGKDRLVNEKISIYGNNRKLLYTNSDSISLIVNEQLFKKIEFENRLEYYEGKFEILALNYKNKESNFVVFAAAYDQYGLSKLKNLRNTLILLFVFIISIVAIAGWLFSGKALQPLMRIVGEVENIEVDRFGKRLIKNKYNDEIGRLIDTFNTLLERIENAFTLQKIFVTGASHELKNPLTAITSQLQVTLLNERSNEEYKQLINSVLDDIKMLNKTAVDLMEFAKLNYEKEIQLSEHRIDDILWSIKEYFTKNHPEYTVNLIFENLPLDEQNLIITGNEPLLKIAIINLIDNACKFSIDKSAEVKFLIKNKKIKLIVSDNGIGLTKEEEKLIFEPFFRTNNTTETKGHGIGLALVKKIADFHGITIRIDSQKNIGSSFELTFSS
jgi:signal transduction histidine kinase